ncbi:MAG: hypothetical protein KF893_12135 [Caldilineaceae bacterium]|nr:hypothetical protein [Caldilineaceae bacterium]
MSTCCGRAQRPTPTTENTDVKPYPVWVGHRNQCLVKVETDEGIYGWGESGMSFRDLAVSGAVRHYREWLIGRDPMQIGALWQEMYRSQYFEGGRVLTGAQSAIDIALYDIAGKALGVPVCTAASVHLAAAVPNFCWLEIFATPLSPSTHYNETIFPVQLKPDGPRIPVPDGPGLGVDVDEEYIKRQEFKFAEPPHLHKRDGSVTNW